MSDTTTAPEGSDTGGTAEKRVRKRAAKADAGTTPNESARGEAVAEQKPAAEPAPAAEAQSAGERWRSGFTQGFLTNVLNPKAPVLFLALLPQFVPDGQPVLPRTALLAGLVVLLALLWFPAVALLVDRLGGLLRRPRVVRVLDGLTGLLLTGLGAALLCDPLF